MAKKVAVVTGANRGIGFEIANQLAHQGFITILTARDAEKGRSAAEKLAGEGDVEFMQLDVTSEQSIKDLVAGIKAKHGRLDVLINNAGVFLDKAKDPVTIDLDTMRQTLEANSLGPLRLIQEAVPLMKERGYGRIVNMSSGMSSFHEMTGGYLAYRTSKTALNVITKVLSAELKESGILVNCMCPGWVKTDMGGENAPRTTRQGADTAVWLALLPNDGPTGLFFRDREEVEW